MKKTVVALVICIVVFALLARPVLGFVVHLYECLTPASSPSDDLPENCQYFRMEDVASQFETYLGYTPNTSVDDKEKVVTIYLAGGYEVEVPYSDQVAGWEMVAVPVGYTFADYASYAYPFFSRGVERGIMLSTNIVGEGIYYDLDTANMFFKECFGESAYVNVKVNPATERYYIFIGDNVSVEIYDPDFYEDESGKLFISARSISQLFYNWECVNRKPSNPTNLGNFLM